MPIAVAKQIANWGHQVDILEPERSATRITELLWESQHDAWVLKTVSGGPGLSLLEAASVAGLTTINKVSAIRKVRDKAVAAAVARHHGLPFPLTYFVSTPDLLYEVPLEHYPLVVKPANGSSCRSVYLVRDRAELAKVRGKVLGEGFLLAQPYITNPGTDIKVYAACGTLYATAQRSPLHPDAPVRDQMIALADDVAELVTEVGAVFGLDLFGVDLVEGPEGWMVVDINDFPSFRCVPDAVGRVARGVLRLAAERRVELPPVPQRPVNAQSGC
ncbi:ATP-grasp domain-containing protein [Kutzneria viridogrisea]